MADKVIKSFIAEVMKGNQWRKFANPPAARGKTAFPKRPADQEKFGIRFDYDREVTQDDGRVFHMFKMQPNAGKILRSIKAWRDKKGTDAVMATALVKKGANRKEVEAALQAARKAFKNA